MGVLRLLIFVADLDRESERAILNDGLRLEIKQV